MILAFVVFFFLCGAFASNIDTMTGCFCISDSTLEADSQVLVLKPNGTRGQISDYQAEWSNYLYPTVPHGWCFVDGVLIQSQQDEVTLAVQGNLNTSYVNGPASAIKCSSNYGGPGQAGCPQYIIDSITYTGECAFTTPETMPPICNYPTSNFVPSGCGCEFTCTNGWFRCGNNCVDPVTTLCASGIPSPIGGHGGGNNRRRHLCPHGTEYCRVGRSGWECLETASSLEACGGCPYSGNSVDCSTLPGVTSVSCIEGKCQVHTCDKRHTLVGNACALNS